MTPRPPTPPKSLTVMASAFCASHQPPLSQNPAYVPATALSVTSTISTTELCGITPLFGLFRDTNNHQNLSRLRCPIRARVMVDPLMPTALNSATDCHQNCYIVNSSPAVSYCQHSSHLFSLARHHYPTLWRNQYAPAKKVGYGPRYRPYTD